VDKDRVNDKKRNKNLDFFLADAHHHLFIIGANI
jgi:hypothetical protein